MIIVLSPSMKIRQHIGAIYGIVCQDLQHLFLIFRPKLPQSYSVFHFFTAFTRYYSRYDKNRQYANSSCYMQTNVL